MTEVGGIMNGTTNFIMDAMARQGADFPAVLQRAQEVGLVLSLAAGALVLTMALGAVESVRALMDELGEAAGLSPAVRGCAAHSARSAIGRRAGQRSTPGCSAQDC